MRNWRKLYSSLLESSRAQTLSDSAYLLFTFLVMAQDDSGYYPWEPTKIKRLILTRKWSIEETTAMAQELVSAGMVSWQDGGITIRRGAELNGRPRENREPLLYPRLPATVDAAPVTDHRTTSGKPVADQRATSGTPCLTLEGEGDKDGEERSPSLLPLSRGRRGKPITEEFIEQMLGAWEGRLGGKEATREIIAEALNHTAMDKRKDKQLYLKGWLRREAEKISRDGRRNEQHSGARFDNSMEKARRQSLTDTPP